MNNPLLIPLLIAAAVGLCALAGLAIDAVANRRSKASHKSVGHGPRPRPAERLRHTEDWHR